MSRISTIRLAVILLVAAASISPGQLTCQAPSIVPQRPSTLGEFFRVDPVTGAPTPLEYAKIKTLVGPVQRGHMQTADFYIEGVSSPVTFKAGEPEQFVICLMSAGDDWGKDVSNAEVRMHIGLGKLLVQSSENQRGKPVIGRFITKATIPFDIEPFGQPTVGLDPKNTHPARHSRFS